MGLGGALRVNLRHFGVLRAKMAEALSLILGTGRLLLQQKTGHGKP
jgi:hypothetical protein